MDTLHIFHNSVDFSCWHLSIFWNQSIWEISYSFHPWVSELSFYLFEEVPHLPLRWSDLDFQQQHKRDLPGISFILKAFFFFHAVLTKLSIYFPFLPFQLLGSSILNILHYQFDSPHKKCLISSLFTQITFLLQFYKFNPYYLLKLWFWEKFLFIFTNFFKSNEMTFSYT